MAGTIDPNTALPSTFSDTEVGAALEAAVGLTEIEHLDLAEPLLLATTRNNATQKLINLERFQQHPNRSRGTVAVVDSDGFIAAAAQRGATATNGATLYADPEACRLVAVLNDDWETPGWRDHLIVLDLRTTPEWKLWTGRQGLGPQAKFAETIEEGEAEIVEPAANTMLELAQTFHASTAAKFKLAGRLQDGRTQLTYEEDINATAGESGTLAIPSEFKLGLRPFYGAARYEVRARLRYRLGRGDLQIGFFLHRPDDVAREAFAEVAAQVAEATGLTRINGSPAAPLNKET